jgi:hypothetical protein
MKKFALGVAAAALMAATPATAQYAEFGFGPRGPSVHVGPGYDYHVTVTVHEGHMTATAMRAIGTTQPESHTEHMNMTKPVYGSASGGNGISNSPGCASSNTCGGSSRSRSEENR